MIEKLDFVGNY